MKVEDFKIVQSIQENAEFHFTGRINILDGLNSSFIGVISLDRGKFIQASFKNNILGVNGLAHLLYEELYNPLGVKIVVEPEIVERETQEYNLTYDELLEALTISFRGLKKVAQLRPDDQMRLLVCGDYIRSNNSVSQKEFELLCTISEYSRVKDIYKCSKLFEFEVTETLISLRRKGALKVIN